MRQYLSMIVAAAAVSFVSLLSAGSAEAAGSGCLPGILKQRLQQIRSKFGPVQVISAYRPGARIAGSGKRSFHASCRAVDFLAPAGKYATVVAWLKRTHGGGVGTYSCGMHHIHIDNGPHVRFHHCVSKSGRPISTAKARSSGKRTRIASRQPHQRPTRQQTVRRTLPVPQKTSSQPAKTFSANAHFAKNNRNGR